MEKIEPIECEWGAYGEDVLSVTVADGWVADDGNAEIAYPHATSGEAAAREYAEDGTWGEGDTTTQWVRVYAWRRVTGATHSGGTIEGTWGRACHTIEIDPEEPACAEDSEDHDWQSPHSVLGGLRENPGVQGHGGGVIVREVCRHCGTYRVTDTWAQDPQTGEQGLTSVEYEDADETSTDWVARLRATEMAEQALGDIVPDPSEHVREDGSIRLVDHAPYASDYGGDTEPGSAWDKECDARLAQVSAVLPVGWAVDWDDDDLVIVRGS